jgi:16S rRNA (cytidine1402-2'-O)-methyltransferase
MVGILYLVPTPIGNYDDITLRALNVLKSVDVVVGEEFKECRRLLKHYSIDKTIELINEHNEKEDSDKIIALLKTGKNIALISDSGTPVFSDPGFLLVRNAINEKIRVVPLPGASSILPALTASGFDIDNFVFVGWLSPKSDKRKRELKDLLKEKRPMVIMDTPYRLMQLLRDMADVFGQSRKLSVSYNLTMEDEEIFYGNAKQLYESLSKRNLKGEFVIVVEGIKK